jgi:hypothetical protein
VARLTSDLGRRVDVAALGVTDRTGHLALDPPGRISPNRACRMARAADGWIAVNLAREEDRDLVPAWLHGEFDEDPWDQFERLAPGRACADLVADAVMLGLPAAAVGEIVRDRPGAELTLQGPARRGREPKALKVVDLSALWAGPMCGAILAAMGAQVLRIENTGRPDPTRGSTPEFYRRLNGEKRELTLDFRDSGDRLRLREAVFAADVVIAGARPRAFPALGFSPDEVAARGGVFVAVTGYGWTFEGGARVAFGDDAAAAGGLVRWTERGEPHFLGDALADPVTGLAAAIGALEAVQAGAAGLVDAGLAPCAAGASLCGLRAAA